MISRVFIGAYFVLASIYCFVAYIPYTYLFLIKTPPYPWLTWFAAHGCVLYWLAFLATAMMLWETTLWEKKRLRWTAAVLILQAGIGIFLTYSNFLVTLQNNGMAYLYSILLLAPALAAIFISLLKNKEENTGDAVGTGRKGTLLSYSNAILIAIAVVVPSIVSAGLQSWNAARDAISHIAEIDLIVLVIAAHIWVAMLLVSLVNLFQLAFQSRFARPTAARLLGMFLLLSVGLQVAIVRFLRSALSVGGWQFQVYACLLAAFVVAWGFSVVAPLMRWIRPAAGGPRALRSWLVLAGIAALVLADVFLPRVLGNSDWNGLLQGTFSLFFWIMAGLGFYLLRPKEKSHTFPAVAAILLLCGALYWTVTATAFLWAKPLGGTDWDVHHALETYEADNSSFHLVEQVLGSQSGDSCNDFCRTLRQYTNILGARAGTPLLLAGPLIPSSGMRPDIFIIVIDSLRRDYVGVYNPVIDFTPNLDALARDSIVMRNAFSPYAGTSLAEPAIWSGALLLHSHYMVPFNNLNSLRALAKVDGYSIVVSNDTIIPLLLAPEDIDVMLAADQPWKTVDLPTTLGKIEAVLDKRPPGARPVLCFTQTMDIHELGQPNVPAQTGDNWRKRPGLDNRIAYRLSYADQALGKFIAYLKQRGMYDNSLIVITSDHGEATGELGRRSHSTVLYPEIMRIPLFIHVPKQMRQNLNYNVDRMASLTDITPTLYYLLGHRPIKSGPIYGQPLFADSKSELDQYQRHGLFLASDVRAAFGELGSDGGTMYVTYDSPPASYYFDLRTDPAGLHNVVTDQIKKTYDDQIVSDLRSIADFYGYKPSGGSSGAFRWDRVQSKPGHFATDVQK